MPQEKLWTRPFITLLLLSVMTSAAYTMVNPTLSAYCQSLGATSTQAGMIIGIMSLTALVIRPFAGAASDRCNRKRIMFVATVFLSLSVLGYAFARSLPALIAFRVVHGVAFAVSGTTNLAFASSLVPEKRLGEGVGYLGLGNVLSTALGPNLGLMICDRFGYAACYQVSALLAGIAAVGMLTVPYLFQPQPRRSLALRDLFAKEVFVLALLVGLFSFGNGMVTSYISLLGKERGIANVGWYFTLNSLVLLAVRPLSGRLLDRKGLACILFPAYVLEFAAMMLLGNASVLWMVLLAAVLKAVGQGSGSPAIQAEAIKKLGVARSGVAVSTCYIMQDIAQGTAPSVGGFLAERTGSYTTAFWCSGGLMIAGFCIYLLYFLHERRKQPAKG